MNLKLKIPIFRGRQVSIISHIPHTFHAFFPQFRSIIKMLPKRHFSSHIYCIFFFWFAHLKYIFLFWFRFITYARTFAKFLHCRRVIIHKTSPRDLCRGVWLTATTAVLIKVAPPPNSTTIDDSGTPPTWEIYLTAYPNPNLWILT